MKKVGIFSMIGLVIIAWLVVAKPYGEPQQSNFGSILSVWGEQQEEVSEELTDKAVSGVEGDLVGEHQINGANWSIPNLIRHFLGVER